MSARGPMKQYGHLGLAGLVQRTHARSTGTDVGVYAADQAGMESDPELPWCTVCEEHHNLVCHTTLALARSHAVAPEEWCEDCRDHIDTCLGNEAERARWRSLTWEEFYSWLSERRVVREGQNPAFDESQTTAPWLDSRRTSRPRNRTTQR